MKKKANNRAIVLTLLLIAVLTVTGCKKKEQPPAPEQKPAATAPRPVQAQATSAKVAGIAEQPLDFGSKKDPFKPFATEPVPQPKPVASIRTGELLPIQSYDVNKFTVSGIIVGLKENRALLIDPAGKGYVVKQGMLLGNNDGRISKIGASSIEVVEQYRDEKGRIRKRTITLALSKKK